MALDRPLGEVERGGHLSVRVALGDQGRHLPLAGRQLVARGMAAADPPELVLGSLRPQPRPKALEDPE